MRMRHTRDSCIEVKLKTVLNPQPSQCLYSLYRGGPGCPLLKILHQGVQAGVCILQEPQCSKQSAAAARRR